jgi:F-type H+-transporting ATPase subunit a
MFIVLIELVSNIIRPITLCVRLTANLIAGHLLMSLLGNALVGRGIVFLVFVPILLTILELSVSFIQAYVFITLVTLYTTEIK